MYTALQEYETFIESSPLVVGDLNWNVIWDESPASPLCGDFSETVTVLNNNGLASAYHRFNDIEFGNEPDSTFFMHKKKDRPYHIDYLFIPDTSRSSIREYTVGAYDEWIDASDHLPCVIELAD